LRKVTQYLSKTKSYADTNNEVGLTVLSFYKKQRHGYALTSLCQYHSTHVCF
jgi:hypothetical protein